MAEIPIQEKRGKSMLPYILGGLALLLLLGWLLTRGGDGTATSDTAAASTIGPVPGAPVDTLTPTPPDTGTGTGTGTSTGTGTGTGTATSTGTARTPAGSGAGVRP